MMLPQFGCAVCFPLLMAALMPVVSQEAVEEVAAQTGAKLSVRGFARLQAGEGVARDGGKDFAAEVAELSVKG